MEEQEGLFVYYSLLRHESSIEGEITYIAEWMHQLLGLEYIGIDDNINCNVKALVGGETNYQN